MTRHTDQSRSNQSRNNQSRNSGSTLRRDANPMGAGLMLLSAVIVGLLAALAVRGFQGLVYVPVVMPAFMGWAIGLTIAQLRIKFEVGPRVPVMVAALMGALIAYGAYHLLVHVRVMDFMVANLTTFADRVASNPYVEVQAMFEAGTGERGFLAYLAFTGRPENARLFSMGLLAHLSPGAMGALAAVGLEAVVASVVAVRVALLRSAEVDVSQTPGTDGPRVREVIARTDDATLAAAMEAMDRGDFSEAGRTLRRPTTEETFALALIYNPYSRDSYVLEITEANKSHRVRARRELSSWDGQELWDELRLQRG